VSDVTGGAIVTGSSSGIGRAIAERLAADGFPVLLADIRRDPLTGGGAPTDEEILARGGRCEFVRTDVSSRHECEQLVARAVDSYGRLEVLVNNAVLAGEHSKPLLGTLDADWDAMMAVNLRGAYLLCRAAVRQMLTQPLDGDARGRIINITSQHGMVGCPGHFTYSVGKGGLIQMTRQIAVDYGPQGIICNGVAPGKIVTGTPGDLSASEEGLAYVRSRTPFARLGRSEDVAAAVSFLANEASYVSGSNLMVDGGWSAY
jgi:NAD(P)-dependent dehydrogenase (short-subunit alcohol dehydrogenase family)